MLAEQLCEACGFYFTPMLKLCLMLFCWWLAVQKQLVCDLVRGVIMVLFCRRRIAGQILDRGLGFLAAVRHVDVFDEVLPGSLSFLR